MRTTEKTCFKCSISKPLTEFYAHKKMADGHLNKCKCCTKSDEKNLRFGAGRSRILAYDRARGMRQDRVQARTEYRKTPNGKTAAKKARLSYNLRHQDRRSAHVALSNAVKAGTVTPLPCLVCGEKADAHHPDYSDPLFPVWLCRKHHLDVHRMARELIRNENNHANN